MRFALSPLLLHSRHLLLHIHARHRAIFLRGASSFAVTLGIFCAIFLRGHTLSRYLPSWSHARAYRRFRRRLFFRDFAGASSLCDVLHNVPDAFFLKPNVFFLIIVWFAGWFSFLFFSLPITSEVFSFSIVPAAVLALTEQQLRQIGFSSRKASYLHDLVGKFHSGFLTDSSIAATDDESLFSMLTAVKGIGPWSVHMFMIFSLHCPDVLPVGDLGVRKGVQLLHGLKQIPWPSEMELLCAPWQPYRSAGAWYMWRLADSKGKATMALVRACAVSLLLEEQQGFGEASWSRWCQVTCQRNSWT